MAEETKYRNSRTGLQKLASYLPDVLGGTVVKAKKKKLTALEKAHKAVQRSISKNSG